MQSIMRIENLPAQYFCVTVLIQDEHHILLNPTFISFDFFNVCTRLQHCILFLFIYLFIKKKKKIPVPVYGLFLNKLAVLVQNKLETDPDFKGLVYPKMNIF